MFLPSAFSSEEALPVQHGVGDFLAGLEEPSNLALSPPNGLRKTSSRVVLFFFQILAQDSALFPS